MAAKSKSSSKSTSGTSKSSSATAKSSGGGGFLSDLGRALGIGGGGGQTSSASRPSSSPPPARPSIISVGDNQRMATQDLPRFNITAGQRTTDPSYSAFSLQGLTSTDPANVMRNKQAADMYARMAAESSAGGREGGGGSNAPAAPPAAPPVAAAPEPVQVVAEPSIPRVPQAPAPVSPSDMTSTGPSEDLALESAKQGRKATILTSGQGVGDEPAGLLRRRRSLVGNRGLIV